MPRKLTDLFAWTVTDSLGVEDVLDYPGGDARPLIALDATSAAALFDRARSAAREIGYQREPTLIHFKRVED